MARNKISIEFRILSGWKRWWIPISGGDETEMSINLMLGTMLGWGQLRVVAVVVKLRRRGGALNLKASSIMTLFHLSPRQFLQS